jgi:hypothetical protein
MRITIAATTTAGIRTGCDAKKPPVSSAGEQTTLGRSTATPISIITLTAVKKSAWAAVAAARPATDDPGMLVRKMPIMATVPACAGATALIAVPPCDAAHAVLNERPLRGYATRRMLRQLSPMKADSAVFSARASASQ